MTRSHEDHAHPQAGPVEPSLFGRDVVEARRAALEPGAARGRILHFDAPTGIAGDMTVAALVDLGVPFVVVEQAVQALGLSGVKVELGGRRTGAIFASAFSVREEPQEERTYREIRALLERAGLTLGTRRLALEIFERLAAAEALVHHEAIDDVHFHELGAVDSIVDIVAAAAALDYLEADDVVASPLPVGRGQVRSRHGTIPLPAPATLQCLKGVPTYALDIDGELVTPTGAAIVATVARRFLHWPEMVPRHIGWGSGSRVLPDRANALRVVLGDPVSKATAGSGSSDYVVLEANVDDMTGELMGYVLGALRAAGAADAWATPCTMKKGRPGLVLSVLCHVSVADALGALVLRETSSIGLRRALVSRTERTRRTLEVVTRYGTVPVKVSEGPYGPPELKPEFDVCVELARAAGVPAKEIVAEALAMARKL